MTHAEDRPRTHAQAPDPDKITIPLLSPGKRVELRKRLLEHRPACRFALAVAGVHEDANRVLNMAAPVDVLDATAAAIALTLRGRLAGAMQGFIVKRIREQATFRRDQLPDQIDYAAMRMRSRGILDLPRTDRELDAGRMAWRQYASALVTGVVPDGEQGRGQDA